ncbi:MAG: glutamine synthetase [Prolixibacteraceae bacterium]|nr:glutamine synthetase [Prolixibacteraceae bacterium]
MESIFSFNPNPLVRFLQKPAELFTREDLIKFVEGNHIQHLNFRYVAGDGRLKTLNFIITGHEHLENVLTFGERVDGSSLFPFMETGNSDLYVVPRYRTAFVNPFTEEPSLEILCSFFDHEGNLLELSPEYVLRKAISHFRETTGLNMKMMGELEYYVNSKNEGIFPPTDQKGYHESEPFAKYEGMRKEALRLIASCGGIIKYGHSEVGNFTLGDEAFEQHEIEFLPTDPEFAADQLIIAKWVLRMLAERRKVEISFAPKITVGKAGSGLHFHMLIEKNGTNIVLENGKLSATARSMIAGILDLADALTAFGNTIPTSYLRLVPNQEAPTKICWGERNRSALVRVPLGWNGKQNMAAKANPEIKIAMKSTDSRQTFEFRVPDGSAQIHLIMAGLIVASLHGIQMPGATEMADRLYVEGNIFRNIPSQQLQQLPASCVESAERLQAKREIFEKNGIFPERLIDFTIESLTAFQDRNLSAELAGNPGATRDLVINYIHCQ